MVLIQWIPHTVFTVIIAGSSREILMIWSNVAILLFLLVGGEPITLSLKGALRYITVSLNVS
jgi:hypothetical protein